MLPNEHSEFVDYDVFGRVEKTKTPVAKTEVEYLSKGERTTNIPARIIKTRNVIQNGVANEERNLTQLKHDCMGQSRYYNQH